MTNKDDNLIIEAKENFEVWKQYYTKKFKQKIEQKLIDCHDAHIQEIEQQSEITRDKIEKP